MNKQLDELHDIYGKHQRNIIGQHDGIMWATCNCGRLYCSYVKDVIWYRVTDTDIRNIGDPAGQLKIIEADPLAKEIFYSLKNVTHGAADGCGAATRSETI